MSNSKKILEGLNDSEEFNQEMIADSAQDQGAEHNDGGKPEGETGNSEGSANDGEEVIYRQTVSGQTNDDEDITILSVGDSPAEGDEVKLGENLAEDGNYSFTDDEGNEVEFEVKDGKIHKIEDLTKTVVQNGKKVIKKISGKKRKLTSKQKAAIKKAQKKANTPAAKRARAKSMSKRQALNMSEEQLEKLGDGLFEAVMKKLVDGFELSDELLQHVEDSLGEDLFNPAINDEGNIAVNIPAWTVVNDEINLDDYNKVEFEFEVEEGFDSEKIADAMLTSEEGILDSVLI